MAADHHNDVFHHIRDANVLELPAFLGGTTAALPNIAGLQITKFMVLQVVAFILMFLIFNGLARHIRSGSPARGRFWNFWEMLLVALRDKVVRPTIGEGHHHDHDDHGHAEHDGHRHGNGVVAEPDHAHGSHAHATPAAEAAAVPYGAHRADKYLPYVWTAFFYVLFCNLLGALPWLGSPTGHISVTGALAISTFLMVLLSGSAELGGPHKFFWHLVPSLDVPKAIFAPLYGLMFIIELFGLLVKHVVLSIRLFANIMAGHTVIAVFLSFIAVAASAEFPVPALYWVVTPASVFAQLAIGLLELFVAFLQAYVFAFLSTLFISAAVNPH